MTDINDSETLTKLMLNKAGIIGPVELTKDGVFLGKLQYVSKAESLEQLKATWNSNLEREAKMDEKRDNSTVRDTGALVWLSNDCLSVEWDPHPSKPMTCFSEVKVPEDIARANPELFRERGNQSPTLGMAMQTEGKAKGHKKIRRAQKRMSLSVVEDAKRILEQD